MSSETRSRSYHQCQNMLCGCSFTTITSEEIYLTNIIPQELPEGFEIPRWMSYLDRIEEKNRWRFSDKQYYINNLIKIIRNVES
ncbi:TPA: ogr/Delta-like zinc finger family protein [Proteus mirabilis]